MRARSGRPRRTAVSISGSPAARKTNYTATMQATLPRTAAPAPESTQTPKPVARNLAVDTYRGFVMLLMMAEVVQLARVFRNFPTSRFWSFLAYHQTHVAWAGCSLHDTIQPGFSFLVGVAVPYSIASRL